MTYILYGNLSDYYNDYENKYKPSFSECPGKSWAYIIGSSVGFSASILNINKLEIFSIELD